MFFFKRIALNFAQKYWRIKFSRKATIAGDVFFGRNTKIEIMGGSKKSDIIIGDNVKLYGRIISTNGGKVIIENDVHVGPFTLIGSAELVHIKRHAMISSNVTIMDNNNHPVDPDERKKINTKGADPKLKRWEFSEAKPIILEQNVWVGRQSSILKGVTLGENSILAACGVLSRSAGKNTIFAGNPAREVKKISKD